MHYYLIPAILLMLPIFSFASPAQSIDSLHLVTASPNSSNNITIIGAAPVDPRFTIQSTFENIPIDEDQFLILAVQILGLFACAPIERSVPARIFRDDQFPDVEIAFLVPRKGRGTDGRFFIWGLYLAIKDMMGTNRFYAVNVELRLMGHWVASIRVAKRIAPSSSPLSGGGITSLNSSTILQQRSLSSLPFQSKSKVLDGDEDFNVTASNTASNPNEEGEFTVDKLGRDLPKWDIIITILDSFLALASPRPLARVTESLRVRPAAPFDGVRLNLLPLETSSPQKYITPYLISFFLRDLPVVLRANRWAECEFEYRLDGYLVGNGTLSQA